MVCFSGDGSILLNLQEMATAVELGVDVKVVLLDNACYGLVRQQQDLFYGGRRVASDLGGGIDFCAVARGFGWPALSLAGARDAGAALESALAAPGPQFIHAPVPGDARVYPMVPPGGANHQMITETADAT